MKQRIITPLDGSTRAEAILPYAAALARATGSDIALLQIVAVEQAHALLTDMAAVHAPTHATLERALTLLAEQTLAQHAAMLRAMGIAASYEVTIGEEAAPAILARGSGHHVGDRPGDPWRRRCVSSTPRRDCQPHYSQCARTAVDLANGQTSAADGRSELSHPSGAGGRGRRHDA